MVCKEELEKYILLRMTQKEIASIYNVTPQTIGSWCKKYGLKSMVKIGGAINIKDLTGRRFGKLTVIEFVKTGKHGKEYLCECECGNSKIFRGSTLTSGTVNGCGCGIGVKNNGKIRNSNAILKIGEKHNRLIIIDIKKSENQRGYTMVCKCDCGNITNQIYADLKSGKVKSCGCYNKETSSIAGTIIGMNNYKNNYNWFFIKDEDVIKCRSGYEVIYANYLIKNRIDFLYEPNCFKLGDGKRYTPDFYLINENKYIEIKGSFKVNNSNQKENINLFKKTNSIDILYWDDLVKICNLKYKAYGTYLKQNRKLEITKEEYMAKYT